ncbi:MAG TPA: hypothetical protein VFR91_02010 [Dyella sp.]|nr:hypothetical protein [Dyella sp.]
MLRYVLVQGVLAWGATMFVLMTFVLKSSRLPVWQSALLWAAAGAAYGISVWLVQERRYARSLAARQP